MRLLVSLCIIVVLVGCEQAPPENVPLQESSLPEQPAPTKECTSCDDTNSCTADACSAETGYECTHAAIVPCCGNAHCEQGETYESCSTDCILCAAEKCEEATFDYATQQCVIVPKTPCCGNALCEENETTCLEDCPKCESSEQCFTATYDSIMKKCVMKPIVPCCGNGICDRGESCASCEDDCECEEDIDLSEYPRFLRDGTKIVVGDNATSRDALTATSMTTALGVAGIDTDSNVLSAYSDTALKSNDLIVLGGPCENTLWERYQGVECTTGFLQPSRALIKLVPKGGREIVYVAGYAPLDTQKAAEALNKHSSYDFEGMEVELDTSGATAKII